MLRSTLPAALLFILGYVVTASGLITIRNLIGYVGNGTDIVALLLGGLVAAFIVGLNGATRTDVAHTPLRNRLIRNLTLLLLFLGLSLSVIILDVFFLSLVEVGIDNRLISALLFTFIFLLPSGYLAGQSVPLLSSYLHQLPSSVVAGRVLVSLLMGSVTGAAFSILILMPFAGVHIASLAVIILLTLAVALLNRALTLRTMKLPVLILLGCIALNSQGVFSALGIYYQNAHNSVRIITTEDGTKALLANNHVVAQYNSNTGDTGPETTKAEEILLTPLGTDKSHDILVIGAGGFTFGLKDTTNTYTFVDFDPDIKAVIEKDLLGQTMTPNKTFIAGSARDALLDFKRDGKTFDVVYFNAYQGEVWLPESLVTRDFFDAVRSVLKPDAVIGANLIVSPALTNAYSLYLDQTFHSVFPVTMRLPISPLNVWERHANYMTDFLYVGYNAPLSRSGTIVTDDRNPMLYSKTLNRTY